MNSESLARLAQAGQLKAEPPSLERACATWDWARTAGVSADELRRTLIEAQKPDAEKNRGRTSKATVGS